MATSRNINVYKSYYLHSENHEKNKRWLSHLLSLSILHAECIECPIRKKESRQVEHWTIRKKKELDSEREKKKQKHRKISLTQSIIEYESNEMVAIIHLTIRPFHLSFRVLFAAIRSFVMSLDPIHSFKRYLYFVKWRNSFWQNQVKLVAKHPKRRSSHRTQLIECIFTVATTTEDKLKQKSHTHTHILPCFAFLFSF